VKCLEGNFRLDDDLLLFAGVGDEDLMLLSIGLAFRHDFEVVNCQCDHLVFDFPPVHRL
jgi:hypothetical protein